MQRDSQAIANRADRLEEALEAGSLPKTALTATNGTVVDLRLEVLGLQQEVAALKAQLAARE
jgi:hypothetical protein